MMRWSICLLFSFSLTLLLPAQDGGSDKPAENTQVDAAVGADAAVTEDGEAKVEDPWDYSPYRVLLWLVTDDGKLKKSVIEQPLRDLLDRDFSAVWRLDVMDAPPPVAFAIQRDLDQISYGTLTASDPVLAVKREHPDAVRIRTAKNVGQYVKNVYGTQQRIDDVLARAEAVGDDGMLEVKKTLKAVDGDALSVADMWADEDTEAILVSRGLAEQLTDPKAKLITPEISEMVGESISQYDKVVIAYVESDSVPYKVTAIEFDVLMRHFGPPVHRQSLSRKTIVAKVSEAVTQAFRPVVRIENAGQRSAVGLLRAGGLIVNPESPANVRVSDTLEPMTRKNDRNGNPILIGPLGWAFLSVDEIEGRNIKMDFYAGRAGGLQGRKNNRTFRMALKVRPQGESTLLRLHLQRKPDFPLIGYEIYEKELKSSSMTFVGRTDWDGRLRIESSDRPFRLLYVKNGGAVLARLPLVPGLYPTQIADLSGDDVRLQAEAYIRGVQNSIVDLIAIRELFKARIRLRLERGEADKAEVLMEALRGQPSNEELASDMGRRQTDFLGALTGGSNANQRRKVDEMFTTTRELLSKHINPKMVRDLEALLIKANENGGKLPPEPDAADE
ncbi:MAG: hypothetical protein ACPGLY_00190 [Rubripirellula sp.]